MTTAIGNSENKKRGTSRIGGQRSGLMANTPPEGRNVFILQHEIGIPGGWFAQTSILKFAKVRPETD